MTNEEITNLEFLLGMLRGHLGEDYSIEPPMINQPNPKWVIKTYDHKGRNMKQCTAQTLHGAIEGLNAPPLYLTGKEDL